MKDKNDFMHDVYKLRIQFYSDHTSRMWTRFHILLTAETGLLGFFVLRWFDSTWHERLWLLPIVGIFLSLVWYVLGVQDRYYFEGFRKQIRYLENKIMKGLRIDDVRMFAFGDPIDVKPDLFTRRLKFLSLSRLVAAFPIFFLIVWVIALSLLLNVN